MILNEVKIIEIEWEGPFSMSEIIEKKGETDFGLYMAFGPHRVYGENVLLYVGKAEQQTFATRIPQHGDWWGTESIFLGRLGGSDIISMNEWDELIDYAESKFIQYCLPSWNSSKLNDHKKASFGEAIIFNSGVRLYSIPTVLSDTLFLQSSFIKKTWAAYSNKNVKQNQ